jgi:ligand-binding sensor domain-containing protein/serine phosphatase RsbU (regulator of sigma subunit)
MQIKRYIVICFFLLSGQIKPALGQKYQIIEHADLKELEYAYIYTIVQNFNGYLWIGTSDGLYRYDGFTLNKYTEADSLADNFITCSHRTNNGLWFGHMNGNLSFYDGDSFYKVHSKNSGNSIANLVESPDSTIWAATFTGGLLQLGNKSIRKSYQFENKDITIYSLCFTSELEVLIGSYDGIRLCKLNQEGSISTLNHSTEIPRTKVQDIKKKKSGPGYYILTQDNGMYSSYLSEKQIKARRLNQIIHFPDGIQTFIEDKKSDIWLGTFGHGLHKVTMANDSLASDIVQILNDSKDNISENFKTLYQDRDENIWLGKYGSGIQKLIHQTFSFSSFQKKQLGKNITAIWIDNDEKWIGTDKGVFKFQISENNLLNLFEVNKDLPNDGISSLYADKNSLWIGYSHSGIYKIDRLTYRSHKVQIHEGLLENNITCLTGSGSNLWIGTKKGLCSYNLKTDSIQWYTINKGGLPHNSIKHVLIDPEERTWVTTLSNSLTEIVNNNLKKTNISSDNNVVTLESIAQDVHGNIWIGSAGKGVFLIQKDSIINLTKNEGLYSDYCYSLIGDNLGFIWAGHRGGLSKINATDFSIKSIDKTYEIKEMKDLSPNAVFLDEEEKLWFGMNNGLLTYDPKNENLEFAPPIVQIKSITINNQEHPIKKKIKLSPGKYKLKIDFIGISLKDPDNVKYQYRLVGYDDEWSDITKSRSVVYPRLTEGTYTFELNSSSSEGITTPHPKKIEFTIKTPVYKRIHAYIVLLVIIILLINTYIRRREFIYRHEKIFLEQKVQERTLEIQRQKKEIEKQRDLIRSKNNDITDSLKYARKLQSSIAPPEELLLKLFPEHFLINKPKDIVSGDFCWYTETQNHTIVTVADCTGHGVPGAIMSILGITSLNDIIINYGIINPDRVLELLRLKVITSLSQHSKEGPSLDGMNLGLCVIDQKTLNIQFSGAINNMVHIHEGKLNIIKADRIPIGFSYHEDKPYTCTEFQGQKGDIIYLFSDGFQDQFGSSEDKKYSSRRFIKTLQSVHSKPLELQKRALEDILQKWMGEKEQTDDITILGFKL